LARRRAPQGSRNRARIALAQLEPVLGDVEANVSRHLGWCRRAMARGADLVVFPELSLTGYLLQDLVADVAVSLHDPRVIRPLLSLSRRIAMVVGLVEESADHRFYNSALYLAGGRVVHVHRKVYLPTYGMFDEGRFFAAGDRLQAFATPFGRMGLLICEDLWHPAAALVLAQDRAECLLVISAGPTEGIDRRKGLIGQTSWRDLVKVTAQTQTLFVAYVNRVGFEDGVNFAGGSLMFDPLGESVSEGPILEERLVIGDLDRSTLRRARTLYPLLRDERLPVVTREIQRLVSIAPSARSRRGA
jgi:NAD+ synthase (glutamine-hydrolysing)